MDDQGIKCNEVTSGMLAEISAKVKREYKSNLMQLWALIFIAIFMVVILNLQEANLNEQWFSITVQVFNVIFFLLAAGTVAVFVWAIFSINITSGVIPLMAEQRATIETIPAIEETYGIALSEESKMNIPYEDTVSVDDAVMVRFTDTPNGNIGIGFIERKNDTFFLHRIGANDAESKAKSYHDSKRREYND